MIVQELCHSAGQYHDKHISISTIFKFGGITLTTSGIIVESCVLHNAIT